MSRKKRNILLMVLILGIVALAVVWFDLLTLSGSTAPNDPIDSTENGEIDLVGEQEDTSNEMGDEEEYGEQEDINEELYRTDTQGSVSVGVTFLNPIEEDDDFLNFHVALNTHSVDLDEYDLSQMTTLFLEDGDEITEGIEWTDVEGGGHHVDGILRIERNQGKAALDYTDKEMIRVEIRDLDGVDSRVFEWQKELF